MKKDFEEIIDVEVKRVVDEYSDFFDIVRYAKGMHPIEIVNSLKRLKDMNLLSEKKYYEIDKSKRIKKQKCNIYANPVAHFLDADWRFSDIGLSVLVQNVKNHIKEGQTITFLGTPSLFKYFVNKYSDYYKYVFLDKNANKHMGSMELSENITVIDGDVSKLKLYSVKTDIIVMDPPWYPEYYKLFMSIVCLISKLGTTILSVMPPVTTRPTIKDEYVELEEYLKELGIYISEYKSNIIEYQMPPFERNTLQVNGIINIPDTWRTGDLLIATKQFKVMEQKLLVQKTNDDNVWGEFDYGAVRIKYCVPYKLKVTNGYIELRSIYRNDIYPSVSRRFKGNTDINVWTSGNRVYICNNLPLLHFIFQNWDDRDQLETLLEQKCDLRLEMKEKESINKYVYKLLNIIADEETEYGVVSNSL